MVFDARALADDGDNSLLDDYNALRQNVVPTGLSAREATLAISLSETASVVKSLGQICGKTVLVSGTGVAGLSLVLWLQHAGARVIALGRRREKLEMARKLGADATILTVDADYRAQICHFANGLADGALEATGDAVLAAHILTLLKPDAFAVSYDVPPTGVSYPSHWKTASVNEHECFLEVVALLASGAVKAEWFLSHDWDFDNVLEAFAQVRRGQVNKGVVWISSI